jgi:hypothetical protein
VSRVSYELSALAGSREVAAQAAGLAGAVEAELAPDRDDLARQNGR